MRVLDKNFVYEYLKKNNLKASEITQFAIPDGVIKICKDAFDGCNSLESVVIPDSIIRIGDCVFKDCYSLKSILKSIHIPDSVTEIGRNAFHHCRSLESIHIPDSVTKIGNYAFASCHALESIVIPDGVIEIGESTFENCHSLKSIAIPDSVTWMPSWVFAHCESLESIVIPDSVTEIGDCAFKDCHALKSIVIPDSVTKIGSRAFKSCHALKSIVIPDSVTEIGDCVFKDCHALKSIVIPDSVTEIAHDVFYGCKSLESIVIPDSVIKIGYYAFQGCDSLESIDMPGSVTEIGNAAFENCKSLESIHIPNNITDIGNGVFSNCKSLKSIAIPDGVTKIGKEMFCYCYSLKSIDIPDSVTEIGEDAFQGCDSLESIHISDSVTKIGNGAFENCKSLKFIHIPNNITNIGKFAFQGCDSLESIDIPDSAIEIEDNAFCNCKSLNSVMYKNYNIKSFLDYNCYGENNFYIIKKLIEHDMLKENIFPKAVEAAHGNKLDEFCSDYRDFGTLSIPKSLRNYPDSLKTELRNSFKENKRTGYRVPKCLDKLAMVSHIGNISSQDIVNSFSISYTKDLLADIKPFVPGIVCGVYYPKSTCDMLYEKGIQDMVANTLIGYGSSEDIRFKNAADFIASHPDTSTNILNKISDNPRDFNITENTTVDNIKQEILRQENMGEVHKINKEYGINLNDCVCNIPVISSKYDNRVSRILDFSNPNDIAIGANLGYATNCCQHLHSAGETAMMHGFLNPDAGFFVIEDKNGKVKAQAEIWLANKNTLVFDNIEFANTSVESYKERVDSLRGDLAAFAEKSGYKNIVMGCGYNEFKTSKMEEASKPKLKLTAEEVYLMQEDNDAEVSFENIKQAEEYMTTKEYRASDFVYSDTGKCVYIKHDNQISPYLMEGYDERLLQEDKKLMKPKNHNKEDRLDNLDIELDVSQDISMAHGMSI